MAAGDRTKKIFERVRLFTGIENIDKIPDSLIYFTIDDFQKKLAEETLSIESSANLSIISGVVAEPVGFYRLKFIQIAGTAIKLIPKEITLEEYDLLNRYYLGLAGSLTQYFFKRWGGTLTFYPSPGTVGWTGYYYKLPSTNVSISIDPETPARYDKVLEYGTIADLSPLAGREPTYYLARFEKELDDAKASQARTKTRPLEIIPGPYY